MRGLEDHFGSYGRWEKNRPKVLVDALDREAGAGFLPFNDLRMNGLKALILQTLGGRACGGDGNDEEIQYRSHDSILIAQAKGLCHSSDALKHSPIYLEACAGDVAGCVG